MLAPENEAGEALLCGGLHSLAGRILDLCVCGCAQQLGVVLHLCYKAAAHAHHIKCGCHAGICSSEHMLSNCMMLGAPQAYGLHLHRVSLQRMQIPLKLPEDSPSALVSCAPMSKASARASKHTAALMSCTVTCRWQACNVQKR